MSESTTTPVDTPNRINGKSLHNGHEWPHYPILEQAAQHFPLLNTPGAYTVARERWERLVTSIEIPAPPAEIWRALTDPGMLKHWLAVCHGSLGQLHRDCTLDFEDGEFFLCRPTIVEPPQRLQYLWRWLGIGQATAVTWNLEGRDQGTAVTVTEEAINPPWDWQTWNGGGWPGILEQLAGHLRTGTEWRWPWRRMGPYAQIEFPMPFYDAWDRVFSTSGLRFWLQVMRGTFAPEQPVTILMGDASGMVEMHVREIVQPGQSPPSFLPSVDFALKRPVWNTEVGGRIWLEPAGWGRSIFQVVHYGWENLPPALQLSERKLITAFWAGAMQRASLLCGALPVPTGPHSWS